MENIWGSLFGAGFGAWFGAKLSIWQKNIDEYKYNFIDFKTLIFVTFSLLSNLLNFKRDIVSKKIEGLNEKDLEKITFHIIDCDFSFEIELQKYTFISNKNPLIS